MIVYKKKMLSFLARVYDIILFFVVFIKSICYLKNVAVKVCNTEAVYVLFHWREDASSSCLDHNEHLIWLYIYFIQCNIGNVLQLWIIHWYCWQCGFLERATIQGDDWFFLHNKVTFQSEPIIPFYICQKI